jgi:hypothetical protein
MPHEGRERAPRETQAPLDPWYGSVALDMNIVASVSFPLCASTAG